MISVLPLTPEQLRLEANQWPASWRGDIATHEGWEELLRWERAHGIDTTVGDEQTLAMQLAWLKNIRAGNIPGARKKKPFLKATRKKKNF